MGLLSLSIVVPLGLLFLFSGLVINVIQVLTLIFLLPISRSIYRKANVVLMELLWSELVWLMDWWAGVQGFVAAVSNIREFAPAVYDVTVAVPKESPPPTMKRALSGQSSVVHLHIRRVPTSGLPETEDGLSQWCKDAFILKDDLLDKHKQDNTFGEELYKPISRPVKPLLVVLGWSSLLLYVAGQLLRPLLSTWTGIAWVTGGLGTVFFLMQVFILSTQSERSSNLKSSKSSKIVGANGQS